MIIPGISSSAVAGWASNWYSERKNERIMKERIWNECWLAYDCKFGETWADLEDYRSKRYLSLPWQMTESVTSSMVNGVMPSDDWFNILGRTPSDDSGSKLMQALLKWQHYRSGFRNEIAEILKQSYIFGNVPVAVDWHEELLDIPDPEAFAAQMASNKMMEASGVPVPEENQAKQWPTKTVRKYDGPRIKGGNIFDYVQDLNPSNPAMALRGMRFFRSIGYLKNMSKMDSNGYSLYENIEGLGNETIFRESSDSLKMMTERQVGIAKMPKDMVELIQFEGDIEIPDGMGNVTFYPNHILVIANRTRVVRFEPNPFYHGRPTWELFRLYEEPNELYGRGGIEPILGINDGIQSRYNQTIEANSLAVNPQFKYKEDGVFDCDQFISAPGMLHKMLDPQNNVLPLNVPSEASLSWKEIDFGINQLNLITGASENFGGDPSATQVSIQAGQSANRNRETLNHINYALLIPILEKEIALNQQLMDEATWVRIVSDTPGQGTDPATGLPFTIQPQQFQVSPEEIVGSYDVVAVGANQTSQNIQKSKDLLQITTALLQSPAAKAIKLTPFVNEVYRMASFFDAWKFLYTGEEIIANEQRDLNQQLALKAAGVGPKGPGSANGGQGAVGGPGPLSAPGGIASMAGASEGPGELPGGPDASQLAGNRLD